MVLTCCVINCKEKANKEKGIRLFCVPSALKNQCSKTVLLSERRRAFWIQRINKNLQDEDVKPQTRVCSRHFVSGQTAVLFDYKNPDWAPTLFMGYDQSHLDAIIKKQQLSLSEDIRKLESSLKSMFQSPTKTSTAERVSDLDRVEHFLSSDIQICETAVFEQPGNEIEQACEDVVVEKFIDQLEDSYAQEIVCQKRKLEEIKEEKEQFQIKQEKEQFHQKLSKCEHNNDDLKTQLETLNENNSILLNTVANLTLHEDAFRNDNSKVAYYTGLSSFTLMMHVFGLVSETVADAPLYALSKFQQFLMVLMRLRLNLQEQDLAYRFNVNVTAVSTIFYRWLTAMSYSLERCIMWPDRDCLIVSMPQSFKREWDKSIAVIIDCFEVFTERSSLLSRATMGSQFKNHNTVKFLIGMTPQGTICYISPAYGGRASDKFIVEDCGILDYMLPNDVVIADRGFNVSESVGFTGARLVIPAFTKGKPQLCYNDAELLRKIANVGTHLERLIGLVRNNYCILNSILPVEYLNRRDGDEYALIEHVVRVCCALSNLSPPVVPVL